MNRLGNSLIVAAALIGMGLAGYVGAQQGGRGRPTAVAVVDLGKIINNLQEKAQVDADFAARRQKLNTAMNLLKEELEQLRADFKVAALKPGTPAFEEKREEIDRKTVEFQVKVNHEGLKVQQSLMREYETLYERTLDACGVVARANGYDAVLLRGGEVDWRNLKPEQIGVAMAARKVLWSSDELDITDLVTTRMNNDYKANPRK